jgi:hypothetical protein
MMCVALMQRYDIIVQKEFTHISSELNHVCDSLSRGVSPVVGTCGFNGPLVVGFNGLLSTVLDMCNPLDTADTEETLLAQWVAMERLFDDTTLLL